MSADGIPKRFQKDESRRNVTVFCGSLADYRALLVQPAGDAIEGLVREFLGGEAVFPIKIGDQAAAHLLVALAFGPAAVIEPLQEAAKRGVTQFPFLFNGSFSQKITPFNNNLCRSGFSLENGGG